MSAITLVAGSFLNKAYDYTADKLRQGDITEEKCRELIVRELDDIKSKLEGLARKDLLSSISFFSDGLCLLDLASENTASQFQEASVASASDGITSCTGKT